MEESDQRQLLGRVLSLLAIVLMTSGILVKTVPLESKRPVDPQHAKFSHAGRQDVEARLWEDPFGAIRHLQGSTPGARCEEALKDKSHYPYALSALITRVHERTDITVLPVLIQGGPYFENGESRRRARYAVVTALLNADWEPSDEDKIGYVWTFESCIENAWARRIPELLPYEWFAESPKQQSDQSDASTPQKPRSVLILWVDEDAVSRNPLRGVERLRDLLGHPKTLCDPSTPGGRGAKWLLRARQALAKELEAHKACFKRQESHSAFLEQTREPPCPDSQRGLPWCDMRVIGPSTSPPLQNVVRELARSDSDLPPTRFYSATATADLEEEFSRALHKAKAPGDAPKSTEITIEDLKNRFHERVVRLTTTDEKLVKAFVDELKLRLEDKTPWQRLVSWWEKRPVPCDDTIVIVGEGDTPYARLFRKAFPRSFPKGFQEVCGEGDPVIQVSYLRGLDGVLPTGTGAPAASTPREAASGGTDSRTGMIGNILPDQATLERADGRSQYDYLRRLGEHLIALDRRERQGGRHGVTAIGVLGSDTYDKLLVLDALREYFPRAVFFAADLDARLIGREARRSTRNLVVASAYGLKLHRDLQGAAPPFRDTYQTGIYLATRVAMDSDAQTLKTADFQELFAKPRLFEIGRTRAVALSQVSTGDTEASKRLAPLQYTSIHPDDEWHGFDPLPGLPVRLVVAVMVLTVSWLGLLLSDRVRRAMGWLIAKPSRWGVLAGVLVLVLGLFVAGLFVIKNDVATASGSGEPFAWLEGVSIWPTQILQMLLLILTGALLVFGRVWLRYKIDEVAKKFGVQTLSAREELSSPKLRSIMWTRVTRLWSLDRCPPAEKVEDESATDPWSKFLDCIRLRPSAARVICASVLFFLFSLALLSLDWPSSPHRGLLSAWSNHVLQLVLLAGMTALLFLALDASMMATRLLRARLDQYHGVPCWSELVKHAAAERDPVVDNVQCAAEVISAVNLLIYLPFLTFLLLVPTRSRVFDAWVLPLPYVVLILTAVGVAVLHTIALRHAAAGRRTRVLADIDQMVERYALQAKLAQEGVQDARDGASEPPASAKADLLKSRADRLRGMRDGPFRPLPQEPVVSALLLLLGGTGTLTIVEFLFLGQG